MTHALFESYRVGCCSVKARCSDGAGKTPFIRHSYTATACFSAELFVVTRTLSNCPVSPDEISMLFAHTVHGLKTRVKVYRPNGQPGTFFQEYLFY